MKKKVNSSPRQNMDHLKFMPNEMVPIASRTYGLMRTTNKAVTPYPHVDPGVDAILLKARLSMRRHIDHKHGSEAALPKQPIATTLSQSSKSVNVLPGMTSNFKDLLSLGTPHPTKYIALNAKVLARRLTTMNQEWMQDDPTESRESSALRPPKKKRVRLLDKATVNVIHTASSLDCQRLSDVSLRLTQIDYSVPNSIESIKTVQSFEDRRRMFNLGEYTIARKCKKMSDLVMASTPHNTNVGDHTLQFARKAKDEIDNFIKSQGLIKISNDQLKWNRQLNRLSDYMDSSPPQKISDDKRDIERSHGNSTIDSESAGEADIASLLQHSG